MDFIKDLNIDSIRNLAEDAFNQAKPKSELESKIYEVLSHKNWGSSSTLLNELAQYSYDFDKFPVIIKLMWEGLDNRPAAWRVVFKALVLLEHLIKNGSERCVDDARNHSHQLRGLGNFNYYEGTIDRGLGVREKSKQILEILEDDGRIREERQKAKQLRDKLGSLSTASSGGGGGSSKYAGYGNDSFNTGGGGYGNSSGGGGGGGGGSGYGNGGIDSGRNRNNNNNNFSGRYSDESATRATSTSSSSTTPTFATLPEAKPKKTKVKKLKKKKKIEAPVVEPPAAPTAPAPAAPAADLFSFDSQPAPADEFDAFAGASQSAAPAADEFDAFASATPAVAAFDAFAGATPAAAPDAFDAFVGAPAASSDAFDALASASTTKSTFDAFAAPTPQPPNAFGATNNVMMMQQQQQQQMMMMQQQQQMMNMMGNVSVNPSPGDGIMGGASTLKNKPTATTPPDDDFGDFSGADAKTNAGPVDPLSKLIQLDSLTANKKKPDKTKEPILYNSAAATSFAAQSSFNSTANTSATSFSGIDGLNKTVDISVKSGYPTNRQPGQQVMGMGLNNPMMGNPNMMQPNMMMMMNNPMGGGMMQPPNMMGNNMQPNMMMMNNAMGMGGANGMMMGGMGGVANNDDKKGSMMGGQAMGGAGTMGGQPMSMGGFQ